MRAFNGNKDHTTEAPFEELKKTLLYGLLSNIRQYFKSHSLRKPSDILDNIDIDTLPIEERNNLAKYRDAISLQTIEYPVCITTEYNNTVHRDYYDIKSIYLHIITAILRDNVQVENLHSRNIDKLDNLLYEACFNPSFKSAYTRSTIIINNPLNRTPISPSCINLVSEDYLEDAIRIQKQYENGATNNSEYSNTQRFSP